MDVSLERNAAAKTFERLTPKHSAQNVDDIDLSIITYNSERWLDGFFDSLLVQSFPTARIHLWIVDHGSTDGTQATLETLRQRHRQSFASWNLDSRPNLGFGAGHNWNARKGHAKWILISNVDLEYEFDSILTLLTLATNSANVGAIEARQWPVEHPKYYDPVTLETTWNAHACVLVRRQAFEAIDGYDDRIFMYGEDVDFSFRLRSRGWKLLYCPYSRVRHFSYEDANHIKPLQDRYGRLANAYLRLRYGTLKDRLAILSLQFSALGKRSRYPGAKVGYLGNLIDIARNCIHFSRGNYPKQYFDRWDYEVRRQGIEQFATAASNHVNKPLVSVIVRTHGRRHFLLRQALKSIVNQTYRNLEVIVSEDGGNLAATTVARFTDESGLPTKYLPNPKIGRAAAGNRGMEESTGAFIIFLDDDDLFFPDHIEILVKAYQHQDGFVAYYSLAWEVSTHIDWEHEQYAEQRPRTHPPIIRKFDQAALLQSNFISIQSIMFDRQLFEIFGGFDETLEQLEDWNLWIRYSQAGAFYCTPLVTSLFRTPAYPSERLARTNQLDAAYDEARSRALLSMSKALRRTFGWTERTQQDLTARSQSRQHLSNLSGAHPPRVSLDDPYWLHRRHPPFFNRNEGGPAK